MSEVSLDNGKLYIPGAAAIPRAWELERQSKAKESWERQRSSVLGRVRRLDVIQARTDDFFNNYSMGELRTEAVEDLRRFIFGRTDGEAADLLMQAAQKKRDEVHSNVGKLAVVRFWTPNQRPSRLSATHSPVGKFGFIEDQLHLAGSQHAHFVTRRSVTGHGSAESVTSYDTELAIPLGVMASAHLQPNYQGHRLNRPSRPVLNGEWVRIPLFSARPVPALKHTEIEVHNHFSREVVATDRSFKHSEAAVDFGIKAQDLLRDHDQLPMPHYGNIPGDFRTAYGQLVSIVGEWYVPMAFSVSE